MPNPLTTYLKQDKPIDRQPALDLMMASRIDEYDLALGGYPSLSLAGLSGNVDLSPLTHSRAASIVLTGNPAAAVTVRIPHKEHATLAGAKAEITFVNDCGGSFSTVTIKSTGANSDNASGVAIPTGKTRKVRHNGNSVWAVANEFATAASSISTGLAGDWPLGEPSGTRTDAIEGNDLTDNNTVTSVVGIRGLVAQFTSANSESLSRASNASLQTGDIDFTFVVPACFDTKATNMMIVTKDGSTAGQREYGLGYLTSSDRLIFLVSRATDSLKLATADNFGAVPTGTWILLVAWHDATADTVNVQVNNGTVNSTATTGALQAASSANFRIGARDYASAEDYFNGKIGRVRRWNRVLSAAERTFLWHQFIGREPYF